MSAQTAPASHLALCDLRCRVGRFAEVLLGSEGQKTKNPATFDASAALWRRTRLNLRNVRLGCSHTLPVPAGRAPWYPGDPQGQAWTAGIKKGFAIKSVGGKDVSTWGFWDVMDLLGGEFLDNSVGKFQAKGKGAGNQLAELPLVIEYADFKGEAAAEAGPSTSIDITDPRYADLPRDATLVKYKISKSPNSYTSDVEQLRSTRPPCQTRGLQRPKIHKALLRR